MKKILLVLVIMGMFVMPMIPVKVKALPPGVSPPTQKADIVFARNWSAYPKWPGITGWHHACIYIGKHWVYFKGYGVYTHAIVQADPHCEKWDDTAWDYFWGRQWSDLENYLESKGIGGVEYETLDYIFQWYHRSVHYGRVYGSGSHINQLLQFLCDRAAHPRDWPIRPFDFKSYWGVPCSKQVDGSPGTKGWKYYCAELVWADYKHVMGIDLDYNGYGRVKPKEIYNTLRYTSIGEIYDKYEYPWP